MASRRTLAIIACAAAALIVGAVLLHRGATPIAPPPPAQGYEQLFEEGTFLLKTGLRVPAVRALKRATELDPSQPMGHFWLARAQEKSGFLEDALQTINKVLERSEARRYGESLPDFYNFYSLRGSIKYGLGDYEGSISDYREAFERNPDAGHVSYNLAMAHLALGQLEEALAAGFEAHEHGYRTPETIFQMGKTCRMLERDEEAEALFREAMLLCPGYTAPYQRLAQLLASSGKREEGARIIGLAQKLARVDDEVSKATRGLRLIDVRMYNQFQQEWLEKCALYCEKYGKYEGLKGIMEGLVEAHPDRSDYHFMLGLALLHLQEEEGAKNSFVRALQIDTSLLEAMNQLSFLLASAGDPEVRNPSQSLILSRMARDAGYEGFDYLAVALDASGRTEEARGLVEWEMDEGEAWKGLLRVEQVRFQGRLEEGVVEMLGVQRLR